MCGRGAAGSVSWAVCVDDARAAAAVSGRLHRQGLAGSWLLACTARPGQPPAESVTTEALLMQPAQLYAQPRHEAHAACDNHEIAIMECNKEAHAEAC